ncbi:hypothetical protein Tco_1038843 [Tanacetum coccineum]
MEAEDSLSMGDEHLSTIPKKESEKVIKSSVENLVPIPSESKDLTNYENECDMPWCYNLNENGRGDRPLARECTYQDFKKCQPLNFKGTEGVVGLTRWFEKMETVFHISNCPEKYQVKYATCTLLNSALTWWNSAKRTVGTEATFAMSWRSS